MVLSGVIWKEDNIWCMVVYILLVKCVGGRNIMFFSDEINLVCFEVMVWVIGVDCLK